MARCVAGLGIGDDDVGFASVVGGGQQSRAGIPARAQGLGDRRQRIAGPQHLAAHQVGGQVTVAQPEPVRLHAVRREFLLGVPGFVAVAPPAFGVDTAAQGVHAGVEVGADAHAVHPGVVADVDDRGQFVCRRGSGSASAAANCPRPSNLSTPSRKRAPPTPPTSTVTFTPNDLRRTRVSGDEAGRGKRRGKARRGISVRLLTRHAQATTRRKVGNQWYEFRF